MVGHASILVVEDDLVVRSNLEILLNELGHSITGFADNAVDALVLFSSKHPELVIADISLNGSTDGIDLVKKMNEIRKVPVLFLTAHDDENIFNKAKSACPFAFITKPIERLNLERTIELALENSYGSVGWIMADPMAGERECFYTRIGNKLKKIEIRNVTHIEVDGKYCTLHREKMNAPIHCKISLKDILDRLPRKKFVQVSRNFLVNMDHIEDIDMSQSHITIGGENVPISRSFKEQLFSRMNIV